MKFSSPCDKIIEAFSRCRKLVVAPKKSKTNSHLKNNYATLNDVYKAIREALEDEGLIIIQENLYETGQPKDVCLVQTTIIHVESGQLMESVSQIPLSKIDPQGFGSALTYGKRYALVSIFCLDSLDDDGNKSVKTQAIWKREISNADSMEDIKAILSDASEKCDDAMFAVVKKAASERRAEIEVNQSQSFSGPSSKAKKTIEQQPVNNEQEEF